ncbi:MAG: acetoacetate decarboxylase family protein [Deltaproteobacteria bacterium]|nr:acetoacetate decarboxylase family protein [Deltaproteobacteria bacterium]
MGFVKTLEEIMANMKASADFYDAEMVSVFWETRPEIVEKLLPPPLKPADNPIAMAFVADYPRTNFDVIYQESALFLRAQYKGVEGGYCLAMPVTNDMAMAGGREVFGFPKKIGSVQFKKDGNAFHGWTERRGTRFMEVKANFNGRFNVADADALILQGEGLNPEDGMEAFSYNFKHFPAPEGGTYDYSPRLVKQKTLLHPKEILLGEAEISFQASAYDPWAEIEVVRMLGAIYTKGDNSMLGGEVVAEVDAIQFAPYGFLKWDMK